MSFAFYENKTAAGTENLQMSFTEAANLADERAEVGQELLLVGSKGGLSRSMSPLQSFPIEYLTDPF